MIELQTRGHNGIGSTRHGKKLRRNKAPGPDGVQTEITKWLDDGNIAHMAKIFNRWWKGGQMETELTRAEVVSL